MTGFAWWLGLAQGGTLISALLLLFRQPWRRDVHRAAEAMSVVAGALALIHACVDVGRPWRFAAMLPYPSARGLQPRYETPLEGVAVGLITFAVVSLLFFYVGLIPTFGARRDATRSRFYGVLAMGWRGSGQHWRHWSQAYSVLAALAAVSAFCVQGFDPLVVACALLSGLAVVALITRKHLDALSQLLVTSAVAVGCTWLIQSGFQLPKNPLAWAMVGCAVGVPLLLAIPAARSRAGVVMGVCIIACAGAFFGVLTR